MGFFYSGLENKLPPILEDSKDFKLYATVDKESVFIDVYTGSNIKRIKIGDIVVIQNENELPESTNPLTASKFYYSENDNKFYRYSSAKNAWSVIGGGSGDGDESLNAIIDDIIAGETEVGIAKVAYLANLASNAQALNDAELATTLEDSDLKIPTSKAVKVATDSLNNVIDKILDGETPVGTSKISYLSHSATHANEAEQLSGASLAFEILDTDTQVPTSKAILEAINNVSKDLIVDVTNYWTANGDNGYYQIITVDSIFESDNPIVDLVLGEDIPANKTYKEAWNCIDMITTQDGSITLYAFEAAPVVSFSIRLKVVR